jgi:hypothetical protein
MIDPLLLAVTRVMTADSNQQRLTNATAFFFENAGELFLITNRHVVVNEATEHRPVQLELDVHIDPDNLAATAGVFVPLYEAGQPRWREARDSAGIVDIVAVPLDRSLLPSGAVYEAFLPGHLVNLENPMEVGTALLIVGFPLGFQDDLHHLPVARQATIASAFGMRFEGNGYFLTDSRLHRGTSGSPVVAHAPDNDSRYGSLPWILLGVHSSRIDVGTRDLQQDESLGLNCAWYADVILVLTQPVETDGLHVAGSTAPAG